MDPLTRKEVAAALDLYRRNRGERPVKAVTAGDRGHWRWAAVRAGDALASSARWLSDCRRAWGGHGRTGSPPDRFLP
ncbi:hypothetical protein OG230_32465 [Streptomyces sp. NBC_00234]